MSIVSQVILKADDELRYPSSVELQTINVFFENRYTACAYCQRTF